MPETQSIPQPTADTRPNLAPSDPTLIRLANARKWLEHQKASGQDLANLNQAIQTRKAQQAQADQTTRRQEIKARLTPGSPVLDDQSESRTYKLGVETRAAMQGTARVLTRRPVLAALAGGAALGTVYGTTPRETTTRPPAPPFTTPQPKPTELATPKPTETATPAPKFAIGKLTTANPDVFVIDSDRRASLSDTQRIKVVGYGNDYRFKVQDDKSAFFLEVPISQIQITEGKVIPKEKMPRREYLGIRNDVAGLMDLVPEIGASIVRIAGNGEDVLNSPRLRAALETAKQQNLKILYVFNPNKLLSREEIAQRLTAVHEVLKDYNNVEFELGNEPDNPEDYYWEKRDLATFAKFIKISQEEIRKIRPTAKIIVGALVDIGKMSQLLAYLRKEGVDINGVNFAVHSYNDPADLDKRMKTVMAVTQRPVVITELGTNNTDKSAIIPLLEAAKKYNTTVYIHELPDYEGFGLVNPIFNRPNSAFYYMQNFALKNPK